jgi:hypothetical protein
LLPSEATAPIRDDRLAFGGLLITFLFIIGHCSSLLGTGSRFRTREPLGKGVFAPSIDDAAHNNRLRKSLMYIYIGWGPEPLGFALD